MVKLCGRFGFDLERAWDLTPGEFEDLVAGALDREEVARWNAAIIASVVAGTGGARIPPIAFVDPDAEFGDLPAELRAPEETPQQKWEREQERRRKSLDEKWRAWCTERGIDPDAFG
jgi:hypothetical protein